jgi:hypothetical protein
MRHSRQVRTFWHWLKPATRQDDERRREMADDGAGKASARQKPVVRIEYCTS